MLCADVHIDCRCCSRHRRAAARVQACLWKVLLPRDAASLRPCTRRAAASARAATGHQATGLHMGRHSANSADARRHLTAVPPAWATLGKLRAVCQCETPLAAPDGRKIRLFGTPSVYSIKLQTQKKNRGVVRPPFIAVLYCRRCCQRAMGCVSGACVKNKTIFAGSERIY